MAVVSVQQLKEDFSDGQVITGQKVVNLIDTLISHARNQENNGLISSELIEVGSTALGAISGNTFVGALFRLMFASRSAFPTYATPTSDADAIAERDHLREQELDTLSGIVRAFQQTQNTAIGAQAIAGSVNISTIPDRLAILENLYRRGFRFLSSDLATTPLQSVNVRFKADLAFLRESTNEGSIGLFKLVIIRDDAKIKVMDIFLYVAQDTGGATSLQIRWREVTQDEIPIPAQETNASFDIDIAVVNRQRANTTDASSYIDVRFSDTNPTGEIAHKYFLTLTAVDIKGGISMIQQPDPSTGVSAIHNIAITATSTSSALATASGFTKLVPAERNIVIDNQAKIKSNRSVSRRVLDYEGKLTAGRNLAITIEPQLTNQANDQNVLVGKLLVISGTSVSEFMLSYSIIGGARTLSIQRTSQAPYYARINAQINKQEFPTNTITPDYQQRITNAITESSTNTITTSASLFSYLYIGLSTMNSLGTDGITQVSLDVNNYAKNLTRLSIGLSQANTLSSISIPSTDVDYRDFLLETNNIFTNGVLNPQLSD